MTGDNVEIPFNQHRLVLGADHVLRFVEGVEDTAFLVERCIAAVDVLRLNITDCPTAKANNLASLIPDGKHQAIAELVMESSGLVTVHQEEVFTLLQLEVRLLQVGRQGTANTRRKTKLPLLL